MNVPSLALCHLNMASGENHSLWGRRIIASDSPLLLHHSRDPSIPTDPLRAGLCFARRRSGADSGIETAGAGARSFSVIAHDSKQVGANFSARELAGRSKTMAPVPTDTKREIVVKTKTAGKARRNQKQKRAPRGARKHAGGLRRMFRRRELAWWLEGLRIQ